MLVKHNLSLGEKPLMLYKVGAFSGGTMPTVPKEYREIGARLKEARENADFSQHEAAERMPHWKSKPGDSKQSNMSLYERGLRKISIPDIERLANLYHADLVYLTFGVRKTPKEDADLLTAFKLADDSTQEIIWNILRGQVRGRKVGKKGRGSSG